NGISRGVGKALKEKDEEELERSLRELYANIPYDLHIGEEKYYQSLFLLTMKFVGYEVEGEVHTDKGRADAILRKEEKVIVVEIKYGENKQAKKMLQEGMRQIRDKKYYEKYMGKEVSLLAVAFGKDKEIACKFESV
ncbi:MAG: PD-(D/E)XK nuclease domain-containing protein, partial [Endomicrobium sp.]|nr:PD-(D/E)XK nuclease domain-containing protein [Endomicrobium sp.]